MSILGAIILGSLLIVTHQDGFLLKMIIFILGFGVRIPISSAFFKKER